MSYKFPSKITQAFMFSLAGLVSITLHAETDAFTIEDFRLHTTAELVDVCDINSKHADYEVALAFCYGFIEGATHYDEAISSSDNFNDIVCLPEDVTRAQGVEVLVDYIRANPQYGKELPIDGMFRALVAKWPCAE